MRLYGKLLLSMIAAGALALAALAFMMDWRLGQGFVDYINAADAERLPAIAAVLAEHYREHGGWHVLRRQPRVWRGLLMQAREREELQNDDTEVTRIAPPPRRRHAEPWTPLWARLSVFDAGRERLVGRYGYADSSRRSAIEVDGATVGWIGLHELSKVRSRVAEQFLADQRKGLLWASLAMLVILGLSAAVLARAWIRPIKRIGGVTRRLAGGDFEARAGPAGTDEIGELASDIDFLARSLAEADSARKRWMADSAHELRTPLAVLKGELEALLDGVRPLDRDAIASLHAEAEHLGALIEELRELALADAGALDYQMQTIDFAELLRDCLDTSSGRFGQHPLTIHADLPAHGAPVLGDVRRLRQLIENLFENSLRYTDPGGRLRIELRSGRDGVDLLLDDSAPGVAAELLPRLFEPFVRGDGARSRASGGTGLGLAICQRIVDAHGGTISAQASALGGLSVRVHLPAAGVRS